MSSHYDVVIIGAGAAGLMCAITAAKRGRSVCVLEHTTSIGEKIRISGGGRCNFTNVTVGPANYVSENPHFATSALKCYTPADFIKLVEKHGITYHEKTLGQLFCDGSSKQIIAMLLKECRDYGVTIETGCKVLGVSKPSCFHLDTHTHTVTADALVIATGGLSIPKLGASSFGYDVAKYFGLRVTPTRPALVPLVMGDPFFSAQSGISVDSIVRCNEVSFRENILFTHRGLSGPAILQISSYLEEGMSFEINLLPTLDFATTLKTTTTPKATFSSVLSRHLSKRLSENWCKRYGDTTDKRVFLAEMKATTREAIARQLHHWTLTPNGTEGYAKAEVTRGGVDTKNLSSKTMEALKVPGLFFIGEVVDVTGWLGGYNFQWAWASGVAAGTAA